MALFPLTSNFEGDFVLQLVAEGLLREPLLYPSLFFKTHRALYYDLLIGSVRAVIQLLAIGAILKFVFQLDNVWFTTLILLSMVLNAAWVAAKRGAGIANAPLIAFVSISGGLLVAAGSPAL